MKRRIIKAANKGWAIKGIYGLYTGWWFLRKDAIYHHTKALGKSWKECRKKGDVAVKVLVSEI